MLPGGLELAHHYAGSVMLETMGTEGDGFFTQTLIGSDDLAAALERAIMQNGIFTTVVRSSNADYKLYVEAKATAPGAGFNMTVRVGGTWRLADLRTGQVVFDEFVNASD